MTQSTSQWRIAVAGLMGAVLLAACSGTSNHAYTPPPAQPAQTTLLFSAFAEQVFDAGPNTTPVPVNGVNFTFDVNAAPMAFAALLM